MQCTLNTHKFQGEGGGSAVCCGPYLSIEKCSLRNVVLEGIVVVAQVLEYPHRQLRTSQMAFCSPLSNTKAACLRGHCEKESLPLAAADQGGVIELFGIILLNRWVSLQLES